MALLQSQWYNIGKVRNVETTVKLYHGLYPYKISFVTDYAWLLRYKNTTKETILKTSANRVLSFNSIPTTDDKIDETILVQQYIKTNNIKVRLENVWVTMYFLNEVDVNNAITFVSTLSGDRQLSVWCPHDTAAPLTSDILLVRRKFKYKYKVILSAVKLDKATRKQLLAYFVSIGSEMLISSGLKGSLESPSEIRWVTGAYSFNDKSILTFVSLISHKAIGKIYTQVQITK